MKALLYCTKGKPYLVHESGDYDCNDMTCSYDCYNVVNKQYLIDEDAAALNGKIIAECDYEVEEITKKHVEYFKYCYITESLNEWELMYKSLLDGEMMKDYLQGPKGYAIHIKNLHVFDEPRELAYSTCDNDAYYYSEKYDKKRKCKVGYAITKAPQNMMYVFDGNEKKVLISIHPEHLCKILNGEKTIEVRKTILKYM